jgi:hypothetical protein
MVLQVSIKILRPVSTRSLHRRTASGFGMANRFATL